MKVSGMFPEGAGSSARGGRQEPSSPSAGVVVVCLAFPSSQLHQPHPLCLYLMVPLAQPLSNQVGRCWLHPNPDRHMPHRLRILILFSGRSK